MAYDYNKVKEQYERMDSQQKQQFADMMKGNANYSDFMSRYNSEKSQTSTPTSTTPTSIKTTNNSNATKVSSTPTNTVTSNYTVPKKNGGPADGYASATERNLATGGAEFGGYKNQTSTTPTYTTPTTTSTPTRNDNVAKGVRDAWDAKTYEQQQELLKNNPGLKDAITQAGGTFKTPTTTNTTPTNQTSTNGGWNFQDISDSRMYEIAGHLNDYKVTNPELFDDWDRFYNFFIAGNNRSPEQVKYLQDYFNAQQRYNSLDNMTSGNVGSMMARGEVPEDYLNYVKYANPQRYAEIMDAKDKSEQSIANESYLNTVASQAGFDMGDSNWWKRNQTEMGYRDENNDGLDDRLYHEPTEEELKLVEENNQYEQERAKLTDAMKWLQEDLTNQYPDADLSTIMLLTSDRGNKIQRALDTLAVNQTKVQGSLKYLQNERATMDDAGQKTINELQKQYGMYYDYSPQGIAEKAQAQYAATNVTLDQADYGTDTQKQMALQRVLDDYYAKYGDIIQRSEAQVINDVMALAEQKGISLSQALEENFLKYLRQKPGFEELSTIETKNPEIVKVGDNAYAYWDDGKLVSIGGTLGANGVYQFSDAELRTVGSDGKFTDTVGNDINSIGHILNSEDGLRIGTYTNPKGYTYNVYATREDGIQATENLLKRAYYGMTLGDAAQKWIGQGKDISDAKKVIQSKGLGLNDKLSDANVRKFIEAIGTREGTLKGKSLDEWAKGGKTLGTPKGTEGGQKRNPDLETFLDKWKDAEGDRLKEKDFWAVYGKELEAKGVSKEDFLRQFKEYYSYQSRDAYLEILANLDHLIELTGKDFDRGKRTSALSGLGDAGKVFKYIKNNLTVNGLQEARERGLKLGVLSDSDVKMIAEASSVLDWDVSQGTWNRALQDFRQSLLSNNPYLKEQYKYQSAYSPNVGFKYNDNDKSFTFGTRKYQSGTQGTTQGTTTQAKSIKNLGK